MVVTLPGLMVLAAFGMLQNQLDQEHHLKLAFKGQQGHGFVLG